MIQIVLAAGEGAGIGFKNVPIPRHVALDRVGRRAARFQAELVVGLVDQELEEVRLMWAADIALIHP